MHNDQIVKYHHGDGIAIITLNRPDRYNSVNFELTEELKKALNAAAADDEVRAIILNGEGRGFCAGADLEVFSKGITPEEVRDYLSSVYKPLMQTFFDLRKPIIAAIQGSAAGVGAAIALACDLRIMAESSNLFWAFINIGLGPDGGASWLLARQVGYSRAFQIAIEGKPIAAAECLRLGLTNKVVEEGKEFESAITWAKELAKRPTLAVGITKQDLHYSLINNIYDTIDFEANEQMAAVRSHDLKEGVTAFLQKRKPEFKGM